MAITPGIELIEETHEYQVGPSRYASVTTALEAVLRTKSRFWTPKDRLRGRFVHAIMEAINDGDWDDTEMVLPPNWTAQDREEIISRGLAYQQFCEVVGFEPLASELMVFSHSLRVAGTIDAIGKFTKGQFAGSYGIIDGKSGRATAAAKLQIALYRKCLLDSEINIIADEDIVAHVILELHKNGKPRPIYRVGWDIDADLRDAESVVNVYHFMKRENILG